MTLEELSMHRLVSNFQPFSNELFCKQPLRTDLPYGSKMKPMKVANSGVPDLWTESVENGYYIVPYYFLDEKDNEHTVTVYLLFHWTHIGFNFLKNQSFLTRSKLISFPHFWLPCVFFIQFGHLWQFFWTKWDACNFDHLLWSSSRSNLSSLGLSKFIVWT